MADQLLTSFTGTATTEVFYRFETDQILVYVNGTLANFGTDPNPDPGAQLYWYCIGTTKRTFVGIENYPYAQKIDDPDAVECLIRVCDLAIVTPIVTTNATTSTASDGTATLSYTGTAYFPTSIRYRIGTGDWQTSNVFTGLAPGTYTAWVREENGAVDESEWCTASAPFTIEYDSAYGERYYLDYDDVNGTLLSLKIYEKDYTGEPEMVSGGPSPITIEYSEGEKYEVTKGTRATITLESVTSMQFLGLYSSDERQYRVDHLVDGVLAWRGYLLPDVYNEPFISAPYFVTLTASDGLNTLKNYEYTDNAGNRYQGERSFLDVLFDCLDKLDLDIPVRSVVDVYEANMREATATTDTDPVISDPLFQGMVNTANFITEKREVLDCGKVLEYCLGAFGARIFQSGGRWVIECVDAKRGDYWAVNYTAARVFDSYEVINPVIDVSTPTEGGLIWINGDQQLEIMPAWKNTIVTSDLQVIENVVQGGEFHDIDWSGDVLKGWSGLAEYERLVLSQKNKTNALFIQTPAFNFNVADYVQSPDFPLEAETGTTLCLTFKYHVTTNPADTTIPEVYFQLIGGGYSLTNDGWELEAADKFYTIPVDQPNTVNTFEFITPSIPASGDYYLRIYQLGNLGGSAIRLRVERAAIQVYPAGVLPLEVVEAEITNPARYTFSPDPHEVYFTDTQETTNYKKVHRNYIAINGVQSSSWHVKGQEGDSPLLSILAANMAYNYSRPTHVLRGTLMGDMSYENTIREEHDQGRLFMVNGLSIDPRRRTYAGTFYELITPIAGEVTTGILTEASDFLLTETSDFLLQE